MSFRIHNLQQYFGLLRLILTFLCVSDENFHKAHVSKIVALIVSNLNTLNVKFVTSLWWVNSIS